MPGPAAHRGARSRPGRERSGAHGDGGPLRRRGRRELRGGDCAVGNVSTLEHARRRGLATAITARLLADAQVRGCTAASLQATPMAEGVYAALGFRDLGRFLEFELT